MTGRVTETDDLGSLYRRAFKDYGSWALWNMRPMGDPASADALAITKALRTHGGMEGRSLAERIERLDQRRAGATGGVWPSSLEISSAMLDHYMKDRMKTTRNLGRLGG